jgi:hypothetical protein
MVESGDLFDEGAMQAGGVAISLVRRIFDSVTGPGKKERPRRADPTNPRQLAIRALTAAGMLVALRRHPREAVTAGSGNAQPQVTQEVLAIALRIVEEARDRARQSSDRNPPSEAEAAALEAAGKALQAASKLARRRSSTP